MRIYLNNISVFVCIRDTYRLHTKQNTLYTSKNVRLYLNWRNSHKVWEIIEKAVGYIKILNIHILLETLDFGLLCSLFF